MELNIDFQPFLHAVEPWLVYAYLCECGLGRIRTYFHQELLKLGLISWLLRFSVYFLGWTGPVLFSWFWFKVPTEVFHLPALSFEQSSIFMILLSFLAAPFNSVKARMELTPELQASIDAYHKMFGGWK